PSGGVGDDGLADDELVCMGLRAWRKHWPPLVEGCEINWRESENSTILASSAGWAWTNGPIDGTLSDSHWTGVRAVEGAALEMPYAGFPASWVRIPPCPLSARRGKAEKRHRHR